MQRKGETMKNYNSLLTLQKLVFDKIEFDRKGFKNKNELTFELQVQIGIGEDSVHRVTLVGNCETSSQS